ncbi:MAG: hypothetical protein K2Y22_00600 [Candidatus Obscuribacterales bacterium]|nr:hypothetical protein [Candidatus Obscuribacterales bacterium]
MPKKLSGQKLNSPLTFVWGTFCRKILTDAGKQRETSLIGILPGLTMTIETDASSDITDFAVPFAVWAHAVFKLTDKIETTKKIKLWAMITPPKQEPIKQELDLELKPGHEFSQVNLQLLMTELRKGMLVSEGQNRLKVSFRYETTDLGTIELPIKALIKRVNTK